LLGETGERLKQHARLEERAVFEHAQEVLSDEELNEVGRRSRAFRTRNNMKVGAD
jgi:hemerythrin-like domain-containing protein